MFTVLADMSRSRQLEYLIIIGVAAVLAPLLITYVVRWIQDIRAQRIRPEERGEPVAAGAEEEVVERRFFKKARERTGDLYDEVKDRYRVALGELGAASTSGNTDLLIYYFTEKLAEMYAKNINEQHSLNRKTVPQRENERLAVVDVGDDFVKLISSYLNRSYVVDTETNSIIEKSDTEVPTYHEIIMVLDSDNWKVDSIKRITPGEE